MKKLLIWLPFLLLSTSFISAQNYLDSLNRELNKVLAEDELPGFGVALVSKDKILYSKGFGNSDKSSQKAYSEHTIQNIGSISKTFIGIAIMKAVEEGKLSLDTPINELLPFKIVHPYHPDEPITLKHLATHTAGIKDGKVYDRAYVLIEDLPQNKEAYPGEFWKEYKKMSTHPQMPMSDFFQKVLTKEGSLYTKKNFNKPAPGEKYQYSNIGAALAAYVVELATGEKFESYTRKHIMEPLGMNASGWHFDEVDMANHSQLYYQNSVEIPRYTLITYPDGGFITSIHDLSLYLQEAMKGYAGTGNILKTGSFQEMMQDHAPDEHGYGIFWERKVNGRIGHNGADPGVFTYMQFDPETKLGRIVFINTDPSKESIPQVRKIWQTLEKYGIKMIDTENQQ